MKKSKFLTGIVAILAIAALLFCSGTSPQKSIATKVTKEEKNEVTAMVNAVSDHQAIIIADDTTTRQITYMYVNASKYYLTKAEDALSKKDLTSARTYIDLSISNLIQYKQYKTTRATAL